MSVFYLHSWEIFLLDITFWVDTFFLFITWRCFPLSFIVFVENSVAIWVFPCMYCVVFPDCFQDFLYFWFSAVWLLCVQAWFLSKLSFLKFAELFVYINLRMCFPEFGKFSAIISWNIFLPSCFSNNYSYIRLFEILPWIPEALLFFSVFLNLRYN